VPSDVGQGHPESADIAGMPAEYLIRQMAYYKAGTRKDDARMGHYRRSSALVHSERTLYTLRRLSGPTRHTQQLKRD
jgi:hypothetical protein